MAFYDIPKPERDKLVEQINNDILSEIIKDRKKKITSYFSDEDTYIRKTAYLAIGKIYNSDRSLRKKVSALLETLLKAYDFKIRQTVVNTAGEIGKTDFEVVQHFFDTGLFDKHHSIRNAVIGSVKKMGEKNHEPVLQWARKYLHHEDKEIRREICHGIELRGRTHPQDILPMLKELQHDKTKRVRNTLIHVIGQIAYKKGCLEIVVADLKNWDNKDVVRDARERIADDS